MSSLFESGNREVVSHVCLNRGLAHFTRSDLILLLQFLWFFQPVHYEFLTVKILQHEPIHVVRRALDLEETISLHEEPTSPPKMTNFIGLGQSRGTFYAVLFHAFDKRFGAHAS